jgi:hypothetical protein
MEFVCPFTVLFITGHLSNSDSEQWSGAVGGKVMTGRTPWVHTYTCHSLKCMSECAHPIFNAYFEVLSSSFCQTPVTSRKTLVGRCFGVSKREGGTHKFQKQAISDLYQGLVRKSAVCRSDTNRTHSIFFCKYTKT